MGTRAVPVIANLVMGYLELKIYHSSRLKFGTVVHGYLKENWKRYSDDCFIIWNDTIDKLINFKIMLNDFNSNIQFTMRYNNKQLSFLNILAKVLNTPIELDIFYKPKDSKQYLLFNLCHTEHENYYTFKFSEANLYFSFRPQYLWTETPGTEIDTDI